MEAHLIKHALRVAAGGNDGYHPHGWNPKLRVTVMGPTPPDAELVWTMYMPDGSMWFEHSVAMPELDDEEMHDASLQRWESGTDITEEGTFGFTVRLVNELDGIDIVLHDGMMAVSRRDGGTNVFGVDHSSLLTTGLVALDVYDEHDAPKVRATAFLGTSIGTSVDTDEVEAHIFFNGKRFAKASDISSGFDFSTNDGQSLGREFIAEFDDVRGWNNLSAEGWGDDDWHLLDANDGSYEIKFTRCGKINRTMAFEVAGGRIVKDDVIEPDVAGRPCLWRAAEIVGAFDGDAVADADAPRAYGDIETSLIDCSSDGMYWFRNDAAASIEPASPYDDETAEAAKSAVDTATTLLHTWEDIITEGVDRDDSLFSNFLLQCEIVVMDIDRFEQAFGALDGVADDLDVEFRGDSITLQSAAARVLALRDLAAGYISGARGDTEDLLAPFRSVLDHDKLAIFEDHPANEFRYYTANKHVIETPEELAAASLWFFEGSSDTDAKGTVDGYHVTATITGWRVLGYEFDADGVLIDEFETQGTGSSAPKTAFVGR